MSFIVKGIDMPKEYTQVIAITPNGEVWQVNPIGKNERLEAQAIQIPKKHGRLIDADKIDYDEFWHREGQGFTIAVCQGTEKIIDEQPTILEAEE